MHQFQMVEVGVPWEEDQVVGEVDIKCAGLDTRPPRCSLISAKNNLKMLHLTTPNYFSMWFYCYCNFIVKESQTVFTLVMKMFMISKLLKSKLLADEGALLATKYFLISCSFFRKV